MFYISRGFGIRKQETKTDDFEEVISAMDLLNRAHLRKKEMAPKDETCAEFQVTFVLQDLKIDLDAYSDLVSRFIDDIDRKTYDEKRIVFAEIFSPLIEDYTTRFLNNFRDSEEEEAEGCQSLGLDEDSDFHDPFLPDDEDFDDMEDLSY